MMNAVKKFSNDIDYVLGGGVRDVETVVLKHERRSFASQNLTKLSCQSFAYTKIGMRKKWLFSSWIILDQKFVHVSYKAYTVLVARPAGLGNEGWHCLKRANIRRNPYWFFS